MSLIPTSFLFSALHCRPCRGQASAIALFMVEERFGSSDYARVGGKLGSKLAQQMLGVLSVWLNLEAITNPITITITSGKRWENPVLA